MRKTVLILLGIACCLLFAAHGGEQHPVRNAASVAALCVDHASDEQWLCEQEYNSNLSLPRVCGEIATSSAAPVLSRTISSDPGRTAARLALLMHGAETLKETSFYIPFDPIAGPHAVDYYVYRLRRLII